jgi:hypothetical protein
MRGAGSRTLAITFQDNPYENCSNRRSAPAMREVRADEISAKSPRSDKKP